MESTQPKAKAHFKYFPIQRNDQVFASFKVTMTLGELNKMREGVGQAKEKRGLVLCLDKSGSMAGKPFDGLIAGSIEIAEQIYASGNHEDFVTIFYDQKAYKVKKPSYEAYSSFLKQQQAGGSTNFVKAFDCIQEVTRQHEFSQVSVIFFTDGQDNQNDRSKIDQSLKKLKENFAGIKSRFLTIGFTSDHDAKFLNQITEAGSELGNFYFIDIQQSDYQQQISKCLISSLGMASSNKVLQLNLRNLNSPQSLDIPITLTSSAFDSLTDEEKTDDGHVIEFICDTLLHKDEVENFQILMRQGGSQDKHLVPI